MTVFSDIDEDSLRYIETAELSSRHAPRIIVRLVGLFEAGAVSMDKLLHFH